MTKTIPTTLGVLIIVLVAGVAGASVLFFNQEAEEVALEEETFVEEDEIAEEDEFADWNTYRNEEMGFKFKFPENWTKEECKKIDGGSFEEIEMADCISITDPVIKRKSEMELGGPGYMSNLSIEIEKPINYGVKNLGEYIELLTTKDDEGRTIGGANKLDKTKFLEKDTYIMSPIGHAGAEGIFIVFEKDNYLYRFVFGEHYEDALVDFQFEAEDNFVLKSPEIVGKILSTFRFLD